MKTFRIGLVAEPGGDRAVAGLSLLKDAYGKALGMPVEIFVARDYAALIDAQASARVDYAAMSAMAYAATWQLCECVEPVAAPVGEDGSTGLRAVLIARAGKLQAVDEIAGLRVAVAREDDAAVRRLLVDGLKIAGSPLAGNEPFLVAAASAAEAEAMFVAGSVDAMVGWTPSTAEGADMTGGSLVRLEAAGLAGFDLAVVWRSDLLRYGPHAVRTGLDPEVGTILRAFLVGLKGLSPDVYDLVERHHAGGFAPVMQADYASAVAIVRSLAGVAGAE